MNHFTLAEWDTHLRSSNVWKILSDKQSDRAYQKKLALPEENFLLDASDMKGA